MSKDQEIITEEPEDNVVLGSCLRKRKLDETLSEHEQNDNISCKKHPALDLTSTSLQDSTESCILKNVKITRFNANADHVVLEIDLKESPNLHNFQQFRPGNLLFLISDDLSTIITTNVAKLDQNDIPEGCITLETVDKVLITPDMLKFNYTLKETTLRFNLFSKCTKPSQTPEKAYFALENYFIKSENLTDLPYYLKHEPDLKYSMHLLPTKSDGAWPSSNNLRLDDSQCSALKTALTQKFAMIQGRPGTGKTHVASEIIKILLTNKEHWAKYGPLLILSAATNSLDKLLKNALLYTHLLVRVASQSQNLPLKSYSLVNKYEEVSKKCVASSLLVKKKYELENIVKDIKKICLIIKYLTTPNIIVPYDCLLKSSFVAKFECNKDFIYWLTGSLVESTEEDSDFDRDVKNFMAEPDEHFCEGFRNSDFNLLFDYASIRVNIFSPVFILKNLEEQIVCVEKKIQSLEENTTNDNDDDIAALQKNVKILSQEKLFLQYQLAQHPLINPNHEVSSDPRWNQYWDSVASSYKYAIQKKSVLELEYQKKKLELDKIVLEANFEIFREHEVIGLTSSYAKKIQSSLHVLGASIVLVEEADKMQDEKLMSVLTKDCQHLIFIGNEQFQPETSSSQETGAKLPFLKNITNLGKECEHLTVQYRMQPQINRLFTLLFHQEHSSYECTSNNSDVKGLKNSVFFINHHYNVVDVANKHEAEFLLGLSKYLLAQGYSSSDISILCLCNKQLLVFKNTVVGGIEQIQISTVENYEGNENKIILISLSHDTDEESNYSVYDENVMYLALSRAVEGLYVIGNMNKLCLKNMFWTKVQKVLEEENSIGEFLYMKCQVHNEFVKVNAMNEFQQFLSGGCEKKCGFSLPCGHSCEDSCHVSDLQHKTHICRKLIEITFSKCGHTVEKFCYIPLQEYECPCDCKFRLDCGHVCLKKCHVTSDPHHVMYECRKECAKTNAGCENGHPCAKLCSEPCDPCTIIVSKVRFCGHVFKNVQCSQNLHEYDCEEPCNRLLSCGHKCSRWCNEECGDCIKMVDKKSSCGHLQKVKCSKEPLLLLCNEQCQKTLACGHRCSKKCKEKCTKECQVLVPLSDPGKCGHIFSIPCYINKTGKILSSGSILRYCREPCNFPLLCGHVCRGNCYNCLQGRFHMFCSNECQNLLVCKHRCEVPCDKECQPCQKPCELKCRHSKCSRTCGEPCVPCNEKCGWGCEHKRCTKLCYESCDIEPCTEPCGLTLKCGHLCAGFCGDPCPPLCKICDEDKLMKDFAETKNHVDARYVLLPDCGHVMESSALLTYVTDLCIDSTIQIIPCLKCEIPISTCMRMMNLVKKKLQDFMLVKRKIFYNGEEKQLEKRRTELFGRVKELENNSIVKEFPNLSQFLQQFKNKNIVRKRIPSFSEINSFAVILESFTELVNILSSAKEPMNFEKARKPRVLYCINMIVGFLPAKFKISCQRLQDINLELRRLRILVALGTLSYTVDSSTPKKFLLNDRIIKIRVSQLLYSVTRFSEDKEKQLSEALKLSNNCMYSLKTIEKTKEQKNGNWHKCRYGHFYSTKKSCEKIVELDKCTECKAIMKASLKKKVTMLTID